MKEEYKSIADKILTHYKAELDNRRVKSVTVEEYDFDQIDFTNCKKDIENRLKIKLKNRSIISDFLLNQLTRHKCNLGEVFNDTSENYNFIEYYNSSEILDIIELIEQKKMKGNSFKHLPLKGLLKIHHNAYSGLGYSLVKNICKYWFDEKTGILKREKEFESIITDIDTQDIISIANQMHTKATFKKLTGEWLIYVNYNNINYYLCLASHKEGDPAIYKNKILPGLVEFPELQQTHPIL